MSVASDLMQLLRGRNYRKLFSVRMVSQAGDGFFESGLAALFFFSPENATTATGVALAFAVMLLPFTIIGPWAGPLLDRWRRRNVLLYGNMVRAGLAAAILSTTLVAGPTSPFVYVLALICLGVNRFLLSALSAGLPLVVDRSLLLIANSLTPTLGSIGFGCGVALGAGIRLTTGSDTWVLMVTVCVFGAAAMTAQRIGTSTLGPEHPTPRSALRAEFHSVWTSMLDGAHYLMKRRTPALGLGVMGAHRFIYGITFLATILMSRNYFSDNLNTDGLSTFAILTAGTGLGTALAVVVTPLAHRRVTPERWIVLCLVGAAVAQLVMVIRPQLVSLTIALAILGLAAQGAKIAVDTIVHRDTDDAYRGRAFAFYDVIYNAAFVGAAALAAIALPDSGYSSIVFTVLAVGYLITAAIYVRARKQ